MNPIAPVMRPSTPDDAGPYEPPDDDSRRWWAAEMLGEDRPLIEGEFVAAYPVIRGAILHLLSKFGHPGDRTGEEADHA